VQAVQIGITESRSDTGALDAARRLASMASIETSTAVRDEAVAFASAVVPASDVYVAWVPSASWRNLVDVAVGVRRGGANPVPHVAARRLASLADAKAYLSALRDEAAVYRILLIAGETEAREGGFESSIRLLESGLLQSYGIRSVGIAGYPEGHPTISTAELEAALDQKIAYAKANGVDLYIVTQFGFDGRAVVDWLARQRARGVTLPVRVGVAGPASVRTLLKYAVRCGVGASIKALSKRATVLTRLMEHEGPDDVLCNLAPRAEALGVAGLHLFPFGGFMRSVEWLKKVSLEGSIGK
jgi:methylenetetrahydrofolate reductase (NADPH)